MAAADLVTFTSSSTVTNLCDAVGVEGVPTRVVTIGPVTSATARRRGLTVAQESEPHSIEGLLTAVVDELT